MPLSHTPLLMLLLLAMPVQDARLVTLRDLTADQGRYNGQTVEVRGVFQTGEEVRHLCSRPDWQDCEGVTPDKGPDVPAAEWQRLIRAGGLAQTGRYEVWLTLRGRFEALDSARWGAEEPWGGYHYRILVDRVLKVETKKRKAK